LKKKMGLNRIPLRLVGLSLDEDISILAEKNGISRIKFLRSFIGLNYSLLRRNERTSPCVIL